MSLPPIEKDVPLPVSRGTGMTAAIRELKVGESRLLPIVPWRAYGLAYRVLGKGNFKCHKEAGGVRVWRVL